MRLPFFILEHAILPIGDRLLKSTFIEKLRYWRKTVAQDGAHLEQLQSEKLHKILSHAAAKSPYFKLLNIPENADSRTWLKSFPVLAKKTFRENLEFIVTDKNKESLTAIMSSGSTGPPSKVYFSKDELSNNRALQILWWEWAGYKFGKSLLQTGVNMTRSSEKAIKDKLLNTRYIDAMSHDKTQILAELELLREEPRSHFVAYASSLYLFAKIALENNIKDVHFESVVSIGEKLLPQFREAIEKAFACQVYDTYGASEGFLIASQCKAGNYHIMSPHLVLELLDDDGNEVQPGQMGRVVLTGLDNFTTPLIRYEVGDLAIKAINNTCTCGLQLPLLGEVIGRQTEFIMTPSGKYITVQTVVRILKQYPEIDQFKLIQLGENELKLVYVSPKNQLDVREKDLQLAFEEVFGENLNFEFEKVPELPKAKSGKFQLIENLLTTT
ncbi:phenylacetate--CoA ligase family protein [Algoriphagus chordae]|uniref:Phenylacetate-CoA ligase n=1 Tax=Algoriphagus chordae TaxID=237019 RepID=A0A2W7SAU8_9BACT|nr:phenylacetate--CoA ligase family protein [Algoriphagus chordae]PZX47672.1 phenylacetate-CoA ligase [Algoriphagus chordae]